VDTKQPKRRQYSEALKRQMVAVKPDHANPAKVIHEFSHAVLLGSVPEPAKRQWSYSAVEAGVANYLTADFLNSPLLTGLT
jgi:hypothetical protein